MHYFPEDFQCIPQCLKNSFPKNISLKHLTQWYLWCFWHWMWAGVRVPLPLSVWGPGLVSHQPNTQMPMRTGTRVPGTTGSSQGIKSRIVLRTHIRGSVPAGNPPVRGRGGPGRPGGGATPRTLDGKVARQAPPGGSSSVLAHGAATLTRPHTCDEGSWGSQAGSGSVLRTPWS